MTDCGILVYLILSLRFSMLWITLLVRYEAPNALTFCLLVFKKIRQYCETKSKRKRNVTATGTYHGMQLCTSQVFFLSQNHVANFFRKLLTFLVRKLQKTYRCKHFTNFANTFLQLQAFSCTSTGSWISLTKSHWEWHKGRLWEVAALAQKSPGHVLRGQTTSNEESFWKKKR